MSDDLPRVRRLPIQALGGTDGKMLVYCPRRDEEVDLEQCTECARCVGLSLRESYLVCGWHDDATPPHAEEGANVAPDAQQVHPERHARRGAWLTPAPLARFERPIVTAELDESVLDVACRMRDEKVGSVVVVRDGRPIGMITDRDLVLRVVADRRDPATITVAAVVTYDAQTVRRTDGFETAVQTMKEHGVRRLPIVDAEGRVTGIVTADDLIKLLGSELAALGEAIEGNVDGSESR